jgi:hypothetical protein
MKYKHLFWGLILIAIGMLFVLNNLGVVHFSWFSFWRLWPVILLFWGIAILPVKDLVKYILLGIVLVSLFIVINRLPETRPWYWRFHHPENSFRWEWDDDESDTTLKTTSDQNLSVPFDSLSKKGILHLDAAAGNFIIKGSTSEFLSFVKSGDIGNYELTTKDVGGNKQIELKMNDGRTSTHNIKKNEVSIRLNARPAWNLKMSIGAAAADFDLTEYRIDTAFFDAGATSITLKLGELNPKTVVEFNAGVTSIHVDVPKTAGCQVTSESFLVSKTLEGFENKGNHVYQTPNFRDSKNKIYISVKTAVSSVEVARY